MINIARRIQKLEGKWLPPSDTEFSRRILARLEAGRKRVQEARQGRGTDRTHRAEDNDISHPGRPTAGRDEQGPSLTEGSL
jgi:hypothetical protein